MTLRDLINWEKSLDIPVIKGKIGSPSLSRLQEEVNRIFDHFSKGMEVYMTEWSGREKGSSLLAVDLIEEEDSFVVKAELPGIAPEAVDISITKDSLIIRGERKEEKEETEKNYIRRETSYGSFFRQMSLPQTALTDNAEASFKNGILTIKIPKKAEAIQKPRKLAIKKAA